MSDARSPLHGCYAADTRFGDSAARLTIRELTIASLVQVQAWPDAIHAAAEAVAGIAGIKPAGIGHSADTGGSVSLTLAPGRWQIISAKRDMMAALAKTIVPQMGAVTDLSHARLALQIEGAPAAQTLNKHLPIDLHASVFPVGRVAQSMIHHVDVTVLRRAEDQFLVLGFRGFGVSLFETLCDASLEFGYRLEKGDINL